MYLQKSTLQIINLLQFFFPTKILYFGGKGELTYFVIGNPEQHLEFRKCVFFIANVDVTENKVIRDSKMLTPSSGFMRNSRIPTAEGR